MIPTPPAAVAHAGGAIPPAFLPGPVESEWRPSPDPAFEPTAEDEAEDLGFLLGSAGFIASPPSGWDEGRRESFIMGNSLGWLEYSDASLSPDAPDHDRHGDEIVRALGVLGSRLEL